MRIALVGCGAVAQANLMPVLAGHSAVRVTALVDRNGSRARQLADAYGVSSVLTDTAHIDQSIADAVVLATPPAHHAPATIALVRKGLHVLVEKPMATSLDDATRMVDAAEQAGVALAVSLYRRLLPAARLLRTMIGQRQYGRVLRIDIEEGGSYGWQLATLDVLTKTNGGGGVLIDIGSHLIDLLLWVIPGQAAVVSYEDNARGGVETDCLVHFEVNGLEGTVPVRLELSRTRSLRNSIRVECEHGTLELPRSSFTQVRVHPPSVSNQAGGDQITLTSEFTGQGPYVGYDAFRSQIDDWTGAMAAKTAPALSGRSVLPVVALIEECYAAKRPLAEPWTDRGMEGSRARPATRRRRVLITGAGGFLGGRAAELLQGGYGWDVLALVREPKSAARLARWPIEIALGDVMSPADMARVMNGCDAVVHCAVGTSWRADERRESTISGTRTVAEAALASGIKRFVHISTMFVHRRDGEGALTESTPLDPPADDDYGRAKLDAEATLTSLASKGLSVVVLRPTRIYGPFSKTFTVRPLQALSQGRFSVGGDANVPANMVYVDNVVHAISCALDAPAAPAVKAYLISDPIQASLGEFYGAFARQVGTTVGLVPGPRNVDAGRAPGGLVSQFARGLRGIALSSELRALVRKIFETDPIGTLPRRVWESSPRLQQRALRMVGVDAAVVYRPRDASSESKLVYYGEPVQVSTSLAERELGFVACVEPDQAFELTIEWARSARLIPSEAGL